MRLIELRLKNLNSLKGEWHIDFSDAAFLNEGIFAITGQTGAGKTTILDAICLALYAQTPRIETISKSSNEVMTRQTADCFAEVVIEIDKNRYRCRWGQRRARNKSDGNLQDATHEIANADNGNLLESGIKKTKAHIQELIGMDFSQFTRSIMLAQGSFAAFLKSDIGDRAAILEKITGTAIYAKISLNVHEKKRFEEDVLSKLQAGVDGLSLLSIEDENLLAAELKALNQQQNTQRQTFKTLSEQLQWLNNIQQLQNNLSIYQSNFVSAQQAQQDFTSEAKRLDIANKALEIDSQFRELSYSRGSVKKLDIEQQGLLSQIPAQQQALSQAVHLLDDTDRLEKQATDNLQINLPVIAQVRELDSNIKQQSQSLGEDNQRKELLVSNVQILRQAIQNHQQTADRTKIQLNNIDHYFSKYSELNDLDMDMTTFDSNCQGLRALLADNSELSAARMSQHNHARQLQANFELLSKQQDTELSLITQRREQLLNLQQQQAVITQNQPLARMRGEQEQIDQTITQIEQVRFKIAQRCELISQIHKINLALPLLNQELTVLDDLISTHRTDIQNTKLKKQDKQTHLHLLQKVARLEDYIVELKDGIPCPLCGAHEHPYGQQHPLLDSQIDSQIDDKQQLPLTQQTQQQISELETLIEHLEQALSKHHIDHATKHEALNNQQQQLMPLQQQCEILGKDIQDSLFLLFDGNKNYSKAIAAIILPLHELSEAINATDSDNEHTLSLLDSAKQTLLEHKQSLKELLIQHDDLTASISELSVAIESDEKQHQLLISKINNLKMDIKLHSQKADTIEDKIAANFLALTPITSSILSLANKYPADNYTEYLTIDFQNIEIQSALQQLGASIDEQTILDSNDYERHIDRLRQQRSMLNQLKKHFNEQKNSQQQLSNTLSSVSAQIDTQQSQLCTDESTLKNLEHLITDKNTALQQLKSKRLEVFADKNPESEDILLRRAVDDAKAKQANAQRQLDSTQQVLAQLQSRQRQLLTELQAATTVLNTQQAVFLEHLAAAQFVDEDAFVRARLPKEERDTLYLRKMGIDNVLQQAKLQLDSTQQALEQSLSLAITNASQETIAVQHQHIQLEIDQLSQQIGAIVQKLKDNESQKGQQATQLIAINAQKEKLKVWQQLHTLIGSADGKKYRTFAQGLTFEVMISHANSQLQKMSDRYLLIHDDSNPLELNVIDNYQGGDIRSTKNLSGGEGFIISLALALGLSQMASHNIRVDSLFLDEGFGTLDEESLDIALDTLTGLQQEGKLIGIISHVQALKDRILTQIKVEKISGGFSQISGQGCRRVVSDKV